jgi:CRP-like cAMP-binding protein
MENNFILFAAFLGGISAISLPLGSLLGLSWQPSHKIVGAMTAFGGGALIAALAVELVAPTAIHYAHAETPIEKSEASVHLIKLIIGGLIGGGLFIGLNNIINEKGGFLRNASFTISYLIKINTEKRKKVLSLISRSELIRCLPAPLVNEILSKTRERNFEKGKQLFAEGDEGNEVLFIADGCVEITSDHSVVAELKIGDVVGEIALVTGGKRTATATALVDTNALSLSKEYFDLCRAESTEFDQACRELASNRLTELAEFQSDDPIYQEWAHEKAASLRETALVPSEDDIQKASDEHSGAPMAIWVGILLDGIPESFVIGSALVVAISATIAQSGTDAVNLATLVPYTLIAGLFLANFPEAMSSSIGMKKMGWGNVKIFLMWLSLALITSIGAAIGYWLGATLDHGVIVLIEGLAAGAMLTMIASAMIPEAVHLGGGNVTGSFTLLGFLAAISFKFLE